MALTDNLVAWYSMEERFAENLSAYNSVPPYVPLLDTVGPVTSVPGLIGNAVGLTYAPINTNAYLHADEHAVNTLNQDKTFALWFKLSRTDSTQTIIQKVTGLVEYMLVYDAVTGKLALLSATDIIYYSVLPTADEWHFVAFWVDIAANKAWIRMDDDISESGTFAVTLQPGSEFTVGEPNTSIDADIDNLAIWNRILTATEVDELYNGGDGITYEEIAATPAPCREAECCQDNPYVPLSTVGTGQGFDSACEPLPKVIFEPTSGTRVIMPTLVVLRSDNPDAVIHYTSDGTEPDEHSTIYTGPITVSSPATVIRAIAHVHGCPKGPEATAQYQQWSPAAFFTYGCTTNDRAGQWGAFAPDGNADYNWQLQIQFTANTNVLHFDVLQLYSDGKFTGSAWSTKEFIFPWQDDATKQHRAFPLVIEIAAVQQNVAYLNDYSGSLGAFGIGAHTLDLYGQPWTPLGATDLFKHIITFSDGSTVVRIVDSTCDALPASLCPVPDAPVLANACGPPLRVDVQFTMGVGTAYKIFRATDLGGPYTEIDSGVVGASPQTYQDTAISPGTNYFYYVTNIPAGCVAHVASDVSAIGTIGLAVVSISANPEIIDPLGSTTISWSSSDINGNVTISPTIGVKPGNVPGSQSVSPAVSTTYTITGQNICGDAVADSVDVTVNPPASCGGSQPFGVQIQGYSDGMFSIGECALQGGGVIPWTGRFFENGSCTFNVDPLVEYSFLFGRLLDIPDTKVYLSGATWVLDIYGYVFGTTTPVRIWTGTKTVGDTPLGVYNRVSGCSLNPSTVTII